MSEFRVKIETRADGIYIVVDKSDKDNPVTQAEMLKMIESHNLKKVNFNVLTEILRSGEDSIERKISEENVVLPVDESMTIETSKERMNAGIKFFKAENGGKLLTKEEIMSALKEAGISYGIHENKIAVCVQLGSGKNYKEPYLVAEGTPPIHGVDGSIVYEYDITGDKNQPKILGDGTVDYKQVAFFDAVKSGTVLARRINATEGEPGTDIFGKPIQQRPGKPAPKLTKSKNTFVTDDEMELVASTGGQLVISGKTMSISPVLDVGGDVDFSTGNIDFDGCVNVAGVVLSGFSVKASGNIEVRGVVEAATLIAGGAINLYGGIMGRSKGRIESGCNVFTKFAQNATIIAKGNLKSNALLHSDITVDGAIALEGDNCYIVGGTITAGSEVRAKIIGSNMGTTTKIQVGQNSEMAALFEVMKANYEDVKQQFVKLNTSYETIVKTGKIEEMDDKSKAMLVQLLQNRNAVRDKARKLEEEIAEISTAMRKASGRVVAETMLYSGVSVTIGKSHKYIVDNITMSVLKADDGRIKVEPFLGF
jgi:hypothetical protein